MKKNSVFSSYSKFDLSSVSDPGSFVRIWIGLFFPSPDPDRNKIQIQPRKSGSMTKTPKKCKYNF